MYRLVYHLLFLGALLPSPVFGSPPAAGFSHSPEHDVQIMSPKRHPKDDPADLAHLKTQTSGNFYYEGNGAMTEMHVPVTTFPIASLDKSDLVATSCNYASTSMSVSFRDDESWTVASTDWARHRTGFILVSYVPGCGRGVDTLERSFHFVSSMVLHRSERQIVCAISAMEFKHAVHPDHEVEINAGTYGLSPIHNKNAQHRDSPKKRQIDGFGSEPSPDVVQASRQFAKEIEDFFRPSPPFKFDTSNGGYTKNIYNIRRRGDQELEGYDSGGQ
ncbi:hypothetical protein B0H14DRAFT_190513 [Mycena olivaceomarginata]|nr:hypothetical protein B0H14DRAFT_190513 [Mycena olivaceomarginata]